jgi:hypothetical protein
VSAVGPDGAAGAGRGGGGAAPDRRRLRWLLALVALAAVVAVAGPLLSAGATYELLFPPGSAGARDPSLFDPVPHRRVGDVIWLELEPGDTLVLRNEDDVVHQVGGIVARPGETVLHTFSERGTFSDVCSLDLTVFVEVQRR